MILRIGEIIGKLEANNCAGFTLRANNLIYMIPLNISLNACENLSKHQEGRYHII